MRGRKPKLRQVVYVSGKVTGVPNAKKKFLDWGKKIREIFPEAEIILPTEIVRPKTDWFEAMRICFSELRKATAICMLPDWKDSRGAKLELEFARKAKLPVYFLRNSKEKEK